MQSVLVSDFDGTMTEHDFYKLALQQLLPRDLPDYWGEYRAERITHFEALRSMFAAIRAPEREVLDVVRQMRLDPELSTSVKRLQQAGWRVVVASAGCDWYIRRLLLEAGVEIEVHANPGEFDPARGLIMNAPNSSPFYCPELGVDKAGVVKYWQQRAERVAFAGDGFADLPAARLVRPELRFARSDLANSLSAEQAAYRPYHSWSDIAQQLLAPRTA